MAYPEAEYRRDVYRELIKIKQSTPTDEECRAVAHHMEYNIRADRRYANNGYRIISMDDMRRKIVSQIKNNLHANDIPRYLTEYRKYKDYQKNWQLTASEEEDIKNIALGTKKVSDFTDKDYLKTAYIKYFNQRIMPDIKNISWQEKNNLDYHGLWHTEQVALFAIDISVEENYNPLPNLLAAALHDCARKTDGHDPNHGKNCEPIAREYLSNTYKDRDWINLKDEKNIIEAVINHNSSPQNENNIVLNCLQDADSMRLWWERGQNYPAHTPTGQRLANYSGNEHQQIRYLRGLLEKMRATFPQQTTNNQNTKKGLFSQLSSVFCRSKN